MTEVSKKVRAPDLAVMKKRGRRIVMLTAYDATMAKIFDKAGIDVTEKARAHAREMLKRGPAYLPRL